MVLSVINLRLIGVEAVLYSHVENPGVIGGAGAAERQAGPVVVLKRKE
jgi:hypothetical protein